MTDLVRISVVCTPQRALKKLRSGGVTAYFTRIKGAKFSFCVKEECVAKVFTIFSHRCYNVSIESASLRRKLFGALVRRIGLVIGALLFVAVVAMANATVLKVEVVGNGAYLAPDVIAAARECGISTFSLCSRADIPRLNARILSMKGVTFSSVTRRGSRVVIEVVCSPSGGGGVDYKDLVCPQSGKLLQLVAVSGTPLKSQGDDVKKGEKLIGAYSQEEGQEERKTLAAGFARILVTRRNSLFFEDKSERSAQLALESTLLYTDRAEQKSYTVTPCEGGYIYDVTFSYIVTASLNME